MNSRRSSFITSIRMPQILRSVLPGDLKQIADVRVVIAHKTGVSAFLELYAMNAWLIFTSKIFNSVQKSLERSSTSLPQLEIE